MGLRSCREIWAVGVAHGYTAHTQTNTLYVQSQHTQWELNVQQETNKGTHWISQMQTQKVWACYLIAMFLMMLSGFLRKQLKTLWLGGWFLHKCIIPENLLLHTCLHFKVCPPLFSVRFKHFFFFFYQGPAVIGAAILTVTAEALILLLHVYHESMPHYSQSKAVVCTLLWNMLSDHGRRSEWSKQQSTTVRGDQSEYLKKKRQMLSWKEKLKSSEIYLFVLVVKLHFL